MTPPVCAIVVTFHPELQTRRNIERLLAIAPHVVVVDNGSSPEKLECALPEERDRLHVIRNGHNLGIAAALNQGIKQAGSLQYEHVLLFDQDSYPPLDFAQAMWSFLSTHGDRERIGIVVPRYWQESVRAYLPAAKSKDGCVELPMTSGSLCPLATFARCGYMREDLFIDMVDFEFAFRVRDSGLLILECPSACLEHKVASPEPFRLFGRTLFYPSNYSADRRYYGTRNKLVLLRTYFWRYPKAARLLLRSELADRLKMLLGERQRLRKVYAVLHGVVDALRSKLGPRSR